jgi:hypothetical protein
MRRACIGELIQIDGCEHHWLYDPRDLARVYVPSPTNAEYLSIPYADLRRPPITFT